MVGWSAMAGTHRFVVQNDTYAEDLARALSAHGFALVTARSSGHRAWTVTVFDEGPYSVDAMGHRLIEAVAREAAVLARRYGGYPDGGSRYDVSRIGSVHPTDADRVHQPGSTATDADDRARRRTAPSIAGAAAGPGR